MKKTSRGVRGGGCPCQYVVKHRDYGEEKFFLDQL